MKTKSFILGCATVSLCFFGCKKDKDDNDLIKTVDISSNIIPTLILGAEEEGKDECVVTAKVTPAGATEAVVWETKGPNIATVTATPGFNGRSATVKGVSVGETQIYATSASGKVVSAEITVKVEQAEGPVPEITITAHPVDMSVFTGQTRTLKVTAGATEDATLTYQWYKSNDNSEGEEIDGATNATYDVETSLKEGDYYYCCKVSAPRAESKTSDPAKVTVVAAYDIAAEIEGYYIGGMYEGEPTLIAITRKDNFTVDVSVTLTLPSGWSLLAGERTWDSSSPATNPGISVYPDYTLGGYMRMTASSGALTMSFDLDLENPESVITPETDFARIIFSGDMAGNAVRFNITGTLATEPLPPSITIGPQPAANTVVAEGSISASLTVGATVTQGATLTYQWYENATNSNSGGTPIGGETGESFTIPTTLTEGEYFYYCIVSAEGADSKTSDVAKVTVLGAGDDDDDYASEVEGVYYGDGEMAGLETPIPITDVTITLERINNNTLNLSIVATIDMGEGPAEVEMTGTLTVNDEYELTGDSDFSGLPLIITGSVDPDTNTISLELHDDSGGVSYVTIILTGVKD